MPLVGIQCCQGGVRDFDECIHCAAYGEPHACDYPLPLLRYMKDHQKERAGLGYSATGIIACARQDILLREYDYTESPKSFQAVFNGEAHHALMEKWGCDLPGIVCEKRFARCVEVVIPEGTTTLCLSGKPDQLYPEGGVVIDYKTTSWPFLECPNFQPNCHAMDAPKEEHVDQVNIYSWILADGEDVATGDHVAWDIHTAYIQYYQGKYQKSFPAPIWTEEVQTRYVRELLESRARYELTGELPPVLPDQVKVISRGPRKGTEERKRHWRCGFCPVRDVCDQLAEEGR
jgi:hypothetical protein